MKINWIEVKNKNSLNIEKINFSDITLLVGDSGVGKSQILKYINFIRGLIGEDKNLCNSLVHDVCEYTISFTVKDNECIYKLKMDSRDIELESNNNSNSFNIIYENLIVNGKTLIDRNEEYEKLLDYPNLPSPKKNDTLVNIFSEENQIKYVFNEIINIYDLTNMTNLEFNARKNLVNKINNLVKDKPKRGFIVGYHGSYKAMAEILYHFSKHLFIQVKENFKEIFPNVDDVKIKYNKEKDEYELFLKEKESNYLISWDQVSSGMKKVFSFLVIIESIPNGSIVLIDEFENSLGNNCIDDLTDFILDYGRDIQFIITSHHPYIINNMPTDCWKVITRKNSVIKNKSAEELGIGSTKYDAFFELINYLEDEGE